MTGYRNLLLAALTVLCQTFVAYIGVRAGSDLVGLTTVLGAVGATSVGAVFGRGFNKKHAPEQ